MDDADDLRLFYYTMLIGKNQIEQLHGQHYRMHWEIEKDGSLSRGIISFKMYDGFTLTNGETAFRWFVGKYLNG